MPKLRYRLHKTIRFEAAHRLTGLPPGHPCSRPHGHSYQAGFVLSSYDLDDVGFVVDATLFNALKSTLDHQDLNKVLEGVNPTSENLCKWLFEASSQILGQLGALGDVRIEEIWVRETESTMAKMTVEGD